MPVLVGKYLNKIDQKNRIFVPAKHRDILGSFFYINSSSERECIDCYSEQEFNKRYMKVLNNDGKYVSDYDLAMDFFAEANDVAVDSQGRITIPQELIEKAGITEVALVIGKGDHIEIWDKATWEAYYTDASNNFEEVAENLSDLIND